MLPGLAVPGCCLVSFCFLCDIHSVHILWTKRVMGSTNTNILWTSYIYGGPLTQLLMTEWAPQRVTFEKSRLYVSKAGRGQSQKQEDLGEGPDLTVPLLQGFPSHHSYRFFGLVLGSYPGLWASTAASYCPTDFCIGSFVGP